MCEAYFWHAHYFLSICSIPCKSSWPSRMFNHIYIVLSCCLITIHMLYVPHFCYWLYDTFAKLSVYFLRQLMHHLIVRAARLVHPTSKCCYSMLSFLVSFHACRLSAFLTYFITATLFDELCCIPHIVVPVAQVPRLLYCLFMAFVGLHPCYCVFRLSVCLHITILCS